MGFQIYDFVAHIFIKHKLISLFQRSRTLGTYKLQILFEFLQKVQIDNFERYKEMWWEFKDHLEYLNGHSE